MNEKGEVSGCAIEGPRRVWEASVNCALSFLSLTFLANRRTINFGFILVTQNTWNQLMELVD